MGWNGSGQKGTAPVQPKGTTKKPSPVRGLIAGGAVVALAVVAYFAFFSADEKPQKEAEKKPTAIKEVKPAAAPTNKVEKVSEPIEDPARKARREKLAKMTPAERMEFVYEEMVKKPIDLTPTTNRAFRTGTEQMMSWIFTTRLGDMPPPPVAISVRDEAHMAEILIANNPILEGDSEKVKDAKQTVEAVKKEVIDYIKKGGDVKEFLQYYRGQLELAHQEWRESQKAVMQTVRDDPGLVPEFLKEVNSRLEAKGIKPVTLNPHLRQKLGIADE